MPRQRSQSTMDREVMSIAHRMAKELADVVERYLKSATATAGAKKNGVSAGGRGGRRRGRGPNQAVLGQILDVVKKSPGLRSEQIYAKLPQHNPKALKAALAKMRDEKMVKTSGNRRATTYRAA